MKNSSHKLLISLGLVATLALPGMAMADGWGRAPQKFHSQPYQTYHRDGRYAHYGYADRDHARHVRDDRREWREHRHYRNFDRDEYREHEWREHARRYYGYRAFPGAFFSGLFALPSVGLRIDMH